MMRWGLVSAEIVRGFFKGGKDGEKPDLIDQFGKMAADLDQRGLFGVKRGE